MNSRPDSVQEDYPIYLGEVKQAQILRPGGHRRAISSDTKVGRSRKEARSCD